MVEVEQKYPRDTPSDKRYITVYLNKRQMDMIYPIAKLLGCQKGTVVKLILRQWTVEKQGKEAEEVASELRPYLGI